MQPERSSTPPANLVQEWQEHSLRQHVRAASNLQATSQGPTLHSAVGIPFSTTALSDMGSQTHRTFSGGLDWTPAPHENGSGSGTASALARSLELLSSGPYFDSRKLSREALNRHWNEMAPQLRDAISQDRDVPAEFMSEVGQTFIPAIANFFLQRSIPAGGLFAPSNPLLRLKLIEELHSQLDRLKSHEKTQVELKTWIQNMSVYLSSPNKKDRSLVDWPSPECTSQLQIQQLVDLLHRTSVVYRIDEESKTNDNETRSLECVATIAVRAPASAHSKHLIHQLAAATEADDVDDADDASSKKDRKRTADGEIKQHHHHHHQQNKEKINPTERLWHLDGGDSAEPAERLLTLACWIDSRDSDELSLKRRQHISIDLRDAESTQNYELFSYTFPDSPLIDIENVAKGLRALKARLLDGAPAGQESESLTDNQFLTFLLLLFCPENTPEFAIRKFAKSFELLHPHHGEHKAAEAQQQHHHH